jgi:hypothetical protein
MRIPLLLVTVALTAVTASGCSASHHAATTSPSPTCTFAIIEQAGSESACVDSAGDCHAYAYRTVPPNRDLVLKELHGASAERICRNIASFQKPK